MARSAVLNFMKQQGFTPEPPDRATLRFKGLQFQPTIVGSMMLVAILTQSPTIFLLFSALLWLNVLVRRQTVRAGLQSLCRATARATAAHAGTGAPAIRSGHGSGVHAGRWADPAPGLEDGVLRLPGAPRRGLRRAPLRKFCLGAYVYHLLKGTSPSPMGPVPGMIRRSVSAGPFRIERHCPTGASGARFGRVRR